MKPIITYGCEVWHLNENSKKAIVGSRNGFFVQINWHITKRQN